MTPETALLVLLSALLHPVRDLLLKGHSHPESAYLAVTAGWVAIAAAHAAVTGAGLVLPGNLLPYAVLSAVCLTAYYFGTMAALKSGDLSIYYPIIRSSPLLIVLTTWLFAGTRYAPAVLAGIVLIVVAGFMLQRQPGRILANPRTALLAFIAMAGSAGYTIADHAAVSRPYLYSTTPANLTIAPETFLFWVYLMVTPAFAALALRFRPAERGPREHLTGGWFTTPVRVLAASAVSYLSYLAILTAFQWGAGAAETAAVRQASIPVSVVLAALVLRETRFLHRMGWASLIAAGIVLVVLYR